MKTTHKLILAAALAFAVTHAALADPTAFELIKKGNDYVGVQSKDKVLQIHSDKSVATLTPNIWHVLYYDPDAAFKSVEVKFGAGQEMGVSHPPRAFAPPYSEREILDPSKLKVDSDRALKLALEQPLLKALTLKASKLTLESGDTGPVWKVQLWAAKLKKPEAQADIGVVVLSATDGSVVENDLHPNKVD